MPASRSDTLLPCPVSSVVFLYLHIRPRDISYLRFVLEGYDGLAMVSTLDPGSGLVMLRTPGSRFTELMHLLSALSTELAPSGSNQEIIQPLL